MPHEITTEQAPGLTLTARLMQGGAFIGAPISLTESGTAPGHYTGSVPGGTAAGIYTVRVLNGAVRVGAGQLDWDGDAERVPAKASDIPTAASIAAAVWGATTRTLSAAALTAADVWGYVTRTITGGVTAPPTAEENAAAVWGAGTRTLTAGAGASPEEIADAVRLELAPELEAITELSGGGGATDPFDRPSTGYAPGTHGAALHRLNMTPEAGPVLVVPGAPATLGLCRVYAWMETPDDRPAARVTVKFTLLGAGPIASERLLSGRQVVARTNDQGQLVNHLGQPYVDLQRNDLLDAEVSTMWQIDCEQIGVTARTFTLETEMVDLRALLLP